MTDKQIIDIIYKAFAEAEEKDVEADNLIVKLSFIAEGKSKYDNYICTLNDGREVWRDKNYNLVIQEGPWRRAKNGSLMQWISDKV